MSVMRKYIEWEQELNENNIDIDKATAAYREGKRFKKEFEKRRPYYQLSLFNEWENYNENKR